MSPNKIPSKTIDGSVGTCSPFTVIVFALTLSIVLSAIIVVSVQYNKKPNRSPEYVPPKYPYNIDPSRAVYDLLELRRIGPRFTGTAGSNKTLGFIEEHLREANCEVTRDDFDIPVFHILDNATLSISSSQLTMTLQYNKDFVQSQYGGSAPVTLTDTPISRMSTSGCDSGDWSTFPSGSIALVDLNINIPNNCSAFQRALRAQSANASAVIFRAPNDSIRLVGPRMLDFPWHKTSTPGTLIPVLMMSQTIGDILFSSTIPFLMNLKTNSIVQLEMTSNIYCTALQPGVTETVVVGASIDSPKNRTSINSNGSGFTSLIEILKAWTRANSLLGLKNNFVFAFWNAGTLGSLGSSHYLDTLREAGRIDSVKAYIDLNSLASTNGNFLLATDLSPSSGELGIKSRNLTRFYSRLTEDVPIIKDVSEMSSYDVAVFLANDIPAVGTTSGTYQYPDPSELNPDEWSERSTVPMFVNAPYMPCYDLACDDNGQLNEYLLNRVVKGVCKALYHIGQQGIEKAFWAA